MLLAVDVEDVIVELLMLFMLLMTVDRGVDAIVTADVIADVATASPKSPSHQ